MDLERSKLRRVLPRRSWLIQLGKPASLMDDLIDQIIAAAAKGQLVTYSDAERATEARFNVYRAIVVGRKAGP